MAALPWDQVKPYVEGAFQPGRRLIRADLFQAARANGAPKEILQTLDRVDFGMNFSDLEALESYMLRVGLVRPPPRVQQEEP